MTLIKQDKFIMELSYFIVSLHENQCYLGRCRISAKREGAIEKYDLSPREFSDLYITGQKIVRALRNLFSPDLFNHFEGGNKNPHYHEHLIPRYSSVRIFDGHTFVDENWGENYTPYDRNFSIPDETFFKIREAIKKELG